MSGETNNLHIADARWPHFPEYRARAARDIPVLVLEPARSHE